MRFALPLSLVALGFATACGGAPMPSALMAQSRESLGTAEGAGAEKEPQAALHLKMARDGIDRAQRLLQEGENEEADLVLAEAEIDARLAFAIAHEAQAKKAVQAELARSKAGGPTP